MPHLPPLNTAARSARPPRLIPIGGRPAPDRRRWIVRPDDLLVLDFELVNLRVESGYGARAHLVRVGAGPAYLVVTFPPQHVAERAYLRTTEGWIEPPPEARDEPVDAPPIPSVIAGWSRLAFEVPDEGPPVTWTLEGVLAAMRRLPLHVPANALPPGPKPLRPGGLLEPLVLLAAGMEHAGPAAPGAPASPPVGIARARRLLRLGGRSLGLPEGTGRQTDSLPGTLVQDLLDPRVPGLVRPGPRAPSAVETAIELPYEMFLSPDRFATWSHRDAPGRSLETGHVELWHTRLGGSADAVAPPDRTRAPTLRAVHTTAKADALGRVPLDAGAKREIVSLSSSFLLADPVRRGRFYEPQPLACDLLALSALGAWLDVRGQWDPLPSKYEVSEWCHRTTLGRDQYVKVVREGFLFPWGHRASLFAVTEREFDPAQPGNAAYLRLRYYVVVREPLRTYRTSGLTYSGPDVARQGEQLDLAMPFRSARFVTLTTPPLDDPKGDPAGAAAGGCFWPRVGGRPFSFHLVATDVAGNAVDLSMPLVLVSKKATEPDLASAVPDLAALEGVAGAYAESRWPGTDALRATVPLGGQRVAFAESAAPDDTTFAVRSLTFAGAVPGPQASAALGPPRFLPVVASAQVDVPSLQGLTRTSLPADVRFTGRYLVDGFGPGNAGQVFLETDPLDVKFSGQGDRCGALVTPDLALRGISRVTGPVAGALDKAANGTFDPTEWFPDLHLAGARLFGALSLGSILAHVGFDEPDRLPRFEGQLLDPVEKLLADLQRLRERLQVQPVPSTAAARALLDQLLDANAGSITALVRDRTSAPAVAHLSSLRTQLETIVRGIPDPLAPATRLAVTYAAAALEAHIGLVLADGPQLLERYAAGDLLPRAVQARLEWRPRLHSGSIFQARGELRLAVEAAGDTFTSTCVLDDFTLDTDFLRLDFERVQFLSLAGRKPEADVVLRGFAFKDPLTFVESLRDLIPFGGFSGVTVTPEGVTAQISAGLPNLALGIFSLENLSLSAGFAVPFLGPPMTVWFRFCERENPARLTAGLFGGGFYIGLTASANGVTVVEGAIEFGASASVDLGVAAGGTSMMAGLYFRFEGTEVTLAGYFRMRGMMKAFGFVTVTLEVYLEMRYENKTRKCTGTATIHLEVDVSLFSVTVSITVCKKFGGGNADPTLAEMLDVGEDATSADWNAYCDAFA